MPKTPLLPAVGLIALLGACEMRIGNDAGPVADNASASGRAEDGRVTVEAPGFNMSIDVPAGLAARAHVDEDSGLIYPGASFGGIHVQGGGEGEAGNRQGEVEMRLTSADPGERIVAWYRDPARGGDFAVSAASRDGDATLISGTGRRDSERFTVRIAPRAGGGTELRLLLADRD